jgi:hypothetical protein
MTAGLTALYSNINDNSLSPLEPRLGLNYDLDKNNKLFTGAGYHSQMQSSYLYYYRGSQATPQAIADGVYGTEYNKGMGLTKSAHLVAGWEHNFEYPVRIKLETYYQYLWDVPSRNGSVLLLFSEWRYWLWTSMGRAIGEWRYRPKLRGGIHR